jgi:hypothetical protein
VFDYFDSNLPKEHSLQVWQEPPGTLYINVLIVVNSSD